MNKKKIYTEQNQIKSNNLKKEKLILDDSNGMSYQADYSNEYSQKITTTKKKF